MSNVLEEGETPSRELLSIVEEETDHLDSLVTEALEMARIEAGKIRLDQQPQPPHVLVAAALEKMTASRLDREIRIDVNGDLAPVLADRALIGLVIRQLIGNSLKFAGPDSPVTVRAAAANGRITFSVADQGPGIGEHEQERIFEKFYRIPEHSARVPGTGMGLTIAKEIVEAHHGRIWVQSRPGEGSEFSFSLPLATKAS